MLRPNPPRGLLQPGARRTGAGAGPAASLAAHTARAAPGRAPVAPELRLTRRARLLVTVLTLTATIGVVGLAAANGERTAGSLRDAPASVQVQTGDTLWQIAAEIAPAENPAEVVRLLRQANDLGASSLQPGQILIVPRR